MAVFSRPHTPRAVARLRRLTGLFVLAIALSASPPFVPVAASAAGQPCAFSTDSTLADAAQRTNLGCATGERTTLFGAEEFFEVGIMVWRQDSRTIYVLPFGANWRSYSDAFEEGQPERAWLAAPDFELQEPQRGFGKLWREQLGGPGASVGWATSTERGFDAAIQSFQNGTLIRNDTGRVYVLHNNGSWLSQRF